VTLSLLIAALRDNFAKWPGEEMSDFASEASMMIKPDRNKKELRLRIEMREKDGRLLQTFRPFLDVGHLTMRLNPWLTTLS
jgi:hypothetical protein